MSPDRPHLSRDTMCQLISQDDFLFEKFSLPFVRRLADFLQSRLNKSMEETSDLGGTQDFSISDYRSKRNAKTTHGHLDAPDTLLLFDSDRPVVQSSEGNNNVLDGVTVYVSGVRPVMGLFGKLLMALKRVQGRIDGSIVRDSRFRTAPGRGCRMRISRLSSRDLLSARTSSEDLLDSRSDTAAAA